MKSDVSIFLIDDDDDDLYLFGLACEGFTGLDLHTYGSVQDLLTRVEEQSTLFEKQSVILLDINMPIIDGLTGLSVFQAHPLLSKVPCIVYTTSNSRFDVEDAYKNGAKGYFRKKKSITEIKSFIQVLTEYWAGQEVGV